jgi:hypothetical protein
MPWLELKVKPEQTMEVIPENGRKYIVTWRAGRAFVPLHLHNWLIREGVAVHVDEPNLKSQWEKGPGGVNGAAISPFSNYVREVTS